MKDIVIVNINAPQKKVASLYANPSNNTKWMDDVASYVPLSGEPGVPGSKYRLIPKRGSMPLTATVLTRRLPNKIVLKLDASNVTVKMLGSLSTLPDGRTQLVSEEILSFKGVWSKAVGLIARPAIRKAHRRNIEAFKKFAESQD